MTCCEHIRIDSFNGHIECVNNFLLLENIDLSQKSEGDTSLHCVVIDGHFDIIELLLTDYGLGLS